MIKGPYLRVLNTEEVQSVYCASLQILERTGMVVDHDSAREMLEGAGARVDHDQKVVYFPPELVEASLKMLPKETAYYGRTPEYDFTLTVDGEIYSRVAGGATGYMDLHTGQNRRAQIQDWHEFATLVDALPNIHCLATLHCGDIPQRTADIHSLRVLLEQQRKPIVHNAFSLANQRYMIEMLLVVRGGREALAARPVMHHMLSPISPLFLNEDDTSQLLLACQYGIPTDCPVMPTSGTTSPITLAGTLALGNAEFLGTMTLAQTARPGHSMPFFIDPVVADMRSALPLFGAPEIGLLNAAISQLGIEVYGMPPQGIGLDCDGFTTEQALFQKAQNTAMQAMSGGKLIIGAGIVEGAMALSPTQLVIDDEIIAIAKRWVRGMEVSEKTLALDVIHHVGPRGHFLMEEHTLKFLHTGELIDTHLFDRDTRELWVLKGSKNQEQKAREKAQSILKNHNVPELPKEIRLELEKIVKLADRQLDNSP